MEFFLRLYLNNKLNYEKNENNSPTFCKRWFIIR